MSAIEQDKHETPMVFRVFRQGGDVLALMPTLPHDRNGIYCTSYQHIGQHGSADYDGCIELSRPAKPEEYAPLLAELTRIGYRVRPVRRATYAMHQARRDATRGAP